MPLDADEALGRLVPPELRERMRAQALVLTRPVHGRRHGRHASARAGLGLDFRDHRPYVPGDETRMLDWRAVARRERLVLRQTESEDELPVTLLVDGRAGMRYGEGSRDKLRYGLALGVGLLWLASRQGDPIGLALGTAGDLDVSLARPAGGRDRLAAIAHRLATCEPRGACPWLPLLDAVAPRLSRRSLIVLVSDLLDPGPTPDESAATEEALWRGLTHLRARRHDVVVLQVMHRDELMFPWTEDRMLRFEDLADARAPIEAPGRRLRDAYLEKIHAHLAGIESRCEREGLLLHRVVTDEPLADGFVRLLGRLAGQPAAAAEASAP